MLTIENEEPQITNCSCCGRSVTTDVGFVYENGDARGAYYARFSEGHGPRRVQALVSLGPWGEGPWDRVAFPLEIEDSPEEFNVRLVEREECPWQDAQIMGRLLSRAEAKAHERVGDVFHFTDHMVTEDPHIRRYFEGAA